MEFLKSYTPAEIEPAALQRWEDAAASPPSGPHPTVSTIVIPPPNVTGSLHMGHALNNVLQDVLTRWRRMAGDHAVWVPGTDHGGIATQTVVEKLLLAEGHTRQGLGRAAFLERMWRWRQESGDTILMQLKRLGCSCDWSRTRFTMDPVCSRAVVHAFVILFQRGWIYRGRRMVNWCPRCQTALSDIEVEHAPQAGHLWHIRYPLVAGSPEEFIEVATTRPETMLGDTAVAVHPEDTRYRPLVGRQVRLPLMDRLIPVISDEAVDPSFGTGAVKVTPAHDLADFEIGQRHGLAHEIVIDPQGRMTDRAGRYQGLDRFECRKRVVSDLTQANLLASIEDYEVSVSVCYRCLTPLEPLISDQWFLRVQEMASAASHAIVDGHVMFHPASWAKPVLAWLERLNDWCISRQIWWGHQIPIWYCAQSTCPPFAAEAPPHQCPGCGGTQLRQDPDVLDTWFSSALWPFSVFGWPEQSAELQVRYPTWVLVTGHEILYLWVARMVMMGLAINPTGAATTIGQVPFRRVLIHGMVRDKTGKKMSKSLGNVIDPLEIMGRYGTDALRFALVTASVPGRDLQLSDDAFIGGRNFTNKLWNAARFVYLNIEKSLTAGEDPWDASLLKEDRLELADRWILSEYAATLETAHHDLAEFQLAPAAEALYRFLWGSFCDWYVELSKIRLAGEDPQARGVAQRILCEVLEGTLRALHPITPFITEALWQLFKGLLPKERFPHLQHPSIMVAPFPPVPTQWLNPTAASQIDHLKKVVTTIRTVRAEMNVPPGTRLPVVLNIQALHLSELVRPVSRYITHLAKAEPLTIGKDLPRPPDASVEVVTGGELYVSLAGAIDPVKEAERLTQTLTETTKQLTGLEARLTRPGFLERAPEAEVIKLHRRIEDLQHRRARLARNLETLRGWEQPRS